MKYILLLLTVFLVGCQSEEVFQEDTTTNLERIMNVQNQAELTSAETQLIVRSGGEYCSGNGTVVYESSGTYYKYIVGSQGFMMFVGETNSQSNADRFCGQEYIRAGAGLLCESPDGTEQIYLVGTHEYWHCINSVCNEVSMTGAFDKCKQWER